MNASLRVAVKYGLFVSSGLIAYFLMLKLFGLHENPWLRVFNGAIMGAGIFFAIKYYKLMTGTTFTYVDGFRTGLLTGFLATAVFTLVMGVYVFHLDKEFARTILRDWFDDTNQGAGILIIILILEGLASTAVLTLACMQIFKKSQNVGQQENLVERKKEDDVSNT
ncbi:MAG TPA: DUF4199 domain-containing protein [Aquaticitalea sp.]|nr:DUF4199 domain-containing protein [Aquaticitalea sp.]